MTFLFRGEPAALRAGSLFVFAGILLACAAAPPSGPVGTAAATIELAADNLAFDRDTLTVSANAPFAIDFENRESPPHNVSIRGDGVLFVGETFQGPATRTYLVPPLPPSEYTFICDLHPNMQGTLTSR